MQVIRSFQVIILEGGLRDPKTNKGKDKIEHVKVYEVSFFFNFY